MFVLYMWVGSHLVICCDDHTESTWRRLVHIELGDSHFLQINESRDDTQLRIAM